MPNYISTRGASAIVDSASAVLDCYAADGGLYVPEQLPKLDYADMLGLDYAARVDRVLRAFFDFDVGGIADKAFGGTDDIAPTVKIDDNAFFLELWHGKTCSSKDMALSVLPMLIERAKAAVGIKSDILLALSACGDGAASAAEAFTSAHGTRLCVFYPRGDTDDITRLELSSIKSDNVRITGVESDYSAIHAAVRAAHSDGGLIAALKENNIKLSAADGINIGVIVPQIAYFFSAYCDLVNSDEIKSGDRIDFILPVDNFGGVIAGYYAAKMGLPVNKLVLASERCELAEFIDSGEYDVNIVSECGAPVFDNLERLIFDLSGNNAALTSERMKELGESGRFSVSETEAGKLHDLFAGSVVFYEDKQNAIAYMFDEFDYLVDDVTALACAAALDREFVRPTVILSVMDPYRTAAKVMDALGQSLPFDDEKLFKNMESLTLTDAPERLKELVGQSPPQVEAIPVHSIASVLTDRIKNK